MNKSPIKRFIEAVERELAGVHVTEDPPAKKGGIWFLDVELRDRSLAVQWHPRKGFGLSRAKDPIYGEGPHEVFTDALSTARRTAQLLKNDGYTEPPTEAPIAQLRLLRGMSQADLAKRMNIQQAAVSKLERKHNVEVSTLSRVAKALGVRLVLRVEWEGRSVDLNQFELPAKPGRRRPGQKA